VCTTDACNPSSGCTYTNNTNTCNDGKLCTVGDKCQNGSCAGSANPCTHQCYPDYVGTCDPADGTCKWPPNSFKENYTPCTYQGEEGPCDADFCYLGTCFRQCS